MKPTWKDAPEWAKFLAMDENGSWNWYEFEPEFSSERGLWLVKGGLFGVAVTNNSEWGSTLEARP